jgi:hypothetical protein
MNSEPTYTNSLASRTFQNCVYQFERLICKDDDRVYVKMSLVSQTTGLAKSKHMC